MQIANIIVTKDGIVQDNDCLVGTNEGIVLEGKYAGKPFSDSLEDLFYQHCRKANPSLPKEQVFDEDESPENYPDFDGGIYDLDNGIVVHMTHAMIR